MSVPVAPTIMSVDQASGTVVVGIAQATITGSYPVVQYQLFGGPTTGGPFSLLDTEPISPTAIVTFAFDQNPSFGSQRFYVAVAVDSIGQTSAYSSAQSWAAFPAIPPGSSLTTASISPAAFGSYPLLGNDVFLSPFTGEALIGPNGDLMTVSGLECLAQDLRIRLFTEVGELLLHPTFGFWRGKLIGSGQSASTAQALYFETQLKLCLAQEPRVKQVMWLKVNQNGFDSWTIGYGVMAIGVEDPLQANQVVPYSTLTTTASAS